MTYQSQHDEQVSLSVIASSHKCNIINAYNIKCFCHKWQHSSFDMPLIQQTFHFSFCQCHIHSPPGEMWSEWPTTDHIYILLIYGSWTDVNCIQTAGVACPIYVGLQDVALDLLRLNLAGRNGPVQKRFSSDRKLTISHKVGWHVAARQ